jgi:DNA-binding transcriptional regulator YhcF (GntR family)
VNTANPKERMMVKSFNPAKEGGVAKLNFRLDPESGLPLYYQLKTHIEQEIDKGTWKEDEMIPSESELAATYKISISKGYTEQELDGYRSYAREQIGFWAKIEKERKIPTPFE